MKMRLNNDTIKRVVSNDSCIKCWCNNNTASCNPTLIDLCATENLYYIFRPYKSDDSIFFI